jgi:hypothetical protein
MVFRSFDARKTYRVMGWLAGWASFFLVSQYDVNPFAGMIFGPTTFILSLIICVSPLCAELEWSCVRGFVFFIVMMFVLPQGLLGKSVIKKFLPYGIGLVDGLYVLAADGAVRFVVA